MKYRFRKVAGLIHSKLDWKLQRFVETRPRVASIYFALLDDSLSREAAALAAGRTRFHRDMQTAATSYFLLRRNIHRLEKGLIMRPRRSVFALDYIRETVTVYECAVLHAGGVRNNEHRWARDVLRAYFDAVDQSNPVISLEHERFESIVARFATPKDNANCVPYWRDLNDPRPVSYEDFVALSMRRRSVRWFLDRPVPRELVDKALDAATQAPSACNRQPYVYRIFDRPERVREIASIPLGTKGFSEKLTGIVVLVGRLRAYPDARDRHAIYIDGALSAMAFMYALETLGLSSCPINWADIQPQETMIAKAIGLEPDERVIMFIAYGWPDPEGLVPYSAKREHEQLREYE